MSVFGDAYGDANMVMGYAMAESGCDTGDSRSLAVEAAVVGNSLVEDIGCLVSPVRAVYGIGILATYPYSGHQEFERW